MTDQATQAVREQGQPETKWIVEVRQVIQSASKRHSDAVAAFNAAVTKIGLVAAIECRASEVAATSAVVQELSSLDGFLTDNRMDAEEMAAMITKEISLRMQTMMNGFRVAASTSAFGNAVENAQLEARMKMFDSFGGAFRVITAIIARRAQ